MASRKRPARKGKRTGPTPRLPYVSMPNNRTVALSDGGLLQCLHLQGVPFETVDADELNYRLAAREAALRANAHSQLVIHHHILRRRIEIGTDGAYRDPVCADLDRRWRACLSARPLFVNDLFVSILLREGKGKAGAAARASRLVTGGPRHALAVRLRALDEARDALTAALQAYQPRLLMTYETPNGACAEPLELLSALYNGESRPMLVPRGAVAEDIPYRRLSFGIDALEWKGAHEERVFATILSLKEYPPHATPGVLDGLLRLPCEMTLSEHFAYVDRQIGLERIDLAVRRMRAADEDSLTLKQGLLKAKDDLASGQIGLGEHALTLLVRAPSLEELDAATADCASALANIGAVAVREEFCLEPAFWSQFPGNEDYAPRPALISTSAFAGFASLHGYPMGEPHYNHWGPAISVLSTTASTPYFFSFHTGDLGNFTIIGPSGSGKTVILNFLAAQAQKLEPRTFLFDKDRGSEIFVRGIGGRYTGFCAGQATAFNPLQMADAAQTRSFLRRWVARLVTRPGEALSPAEEAVIADAVNANFEQEPRYRRLRYFQELLGGMARPGPGDLAARIAPWCDAGENAWLFDNASDGIDFGARILGFDLTDLLDEPALRTPVLMYLFHRIEQRLDGDPTLILIDEGWKALDDPIFAGRLRDWMKTMRKRNAIVGFGTQSARDALQSNVAAAITEQAGTQIFTPNPRAQREDYCDGFGLSAQELALVRSLPLETHCFLVKQAGQSVIARLDLGDMPDLLIALSGRTRSVRRLEELRQIKGDDPALWWSALVGLPYPTETRTPLLVRQ